MRFRSPPVPALGTAMRFLFNALAEVCEVDPSVIDLVLWFPHLTWGQFLAATIGVMIWSWVSAQVSRAMGKILRRYAIKLTITVILHLAKWPGFGYLHRLTRQSWLTTSSYGTENGTRKNTDIVHEHKKANASCSWPWPSANSTFESPAPARRTLSHRRCSSRPYAASSYPHPLQAGGRRRLGGLGYPAT